MIYLLRHGETEWNREGRLQGHGDSPLTERGMAQAVAMGGAVRRAVVEAGEDPAAYTLVSSPLGRALATARCVSAVLGSDPAALVEEPRLMEHGFGAGQGGKEVNPMRIITFDQVDLPLAWPILDRFLPSDGIRRLCVSVKPDQ